MYQIDNYIIYGMSGVCKVIKVGKLEVKGVDAAKLYYTLEPLYGKGSIIYTPVGNDKVLMRSIISKEKALKLVQDIPCQKLIQIYEDKRSEQIYKEAMKNNECYELLQIFKLLIRREYQRNANSKKLSSIDKKYLDLIKDRLIGEFSLALEMPSDMVEKEILEKMELSPTGSLI